MKLSDFLIPVDTYNTGYIDGSLNHLNIIKLNESSIGTGFNWNAGKLDVSGGGDVTKVYVDGSLNAKVNKVGDTMTGLLSISKSGIALELGDDLFGDHNGISFTTAGSLPQKILTTAIGNDPQSLILGTSDTPNNHLVLTIDGNVGIGTTTPAYTLDVSGNIHTNGNLTTGKSLTVTTGGLVISSGGLKVTGDTSLYGVLHADSHVHVGGNLTVDGSLIYTNIQSINISTGFIQLSTGIVGTPPSTLQSGIIVNRGTSDPYVFVYDEDGQNFRIGIATISTSTHYNDASTQAVATREDSPISFGVPFWNNTISRFDSFSGLLYDKNNLSLNGSLNVTGGPINAFGTGTYGGGPYALHVSNGDLWFDTGYWLTFGSSVNSFVSWSGSNSMLFDIEVYDASTQFVWRGKDEGGTMRNLIIAKPREGVENYYRGTKRFETTPVGVNMFGDVSISSNLWVKGMSSATSSNMVYYQSDGKLTVGAAPSGGGGNVAWANASVGLNNQILTSAGDSSIVSEGNLSFDGTNLVSASTNYFYLGSTNANGSWRWYIEVATGDLLFEKRIAGTWTYKSKIS